MSTVSLPSISGSRTSVRASVRRMLSANEIECNNLRSRYKELRRQITVVREENEVLRTQQLRMQAALSGFESGDNDVPHTMKKHSDELRTLREDVRLHNVKLRKAEQKLLKKELKLQQVQDELKQNKALADKDELPEWDLLSNQWSVTSNELTKKDQEIKELEEQVRSMTASHNSTMSKERQYGKELDLQSRKLEDQIRQLQMKIKTVDRELANNLIHEQSRLARSTSDTGGSATVPPTRAAVLPRSATASQQEPSLSLQEKMQQYDRQRRDMWQQQLRKKEEKFRELQEKGIAPNEEANGKQQVDKEKQLKLEKRRIQKEEQEERRKQLKLKLEQEKRRKEREEELRKENEENERLISALEMKVAALELDKRRRQEAEEREREAEAEEERARRRNAELASVQELTEIIEEPVADVGDYVPEVYDGSQRADDDDERLRPLEAQAEEPDADYVADDHQDSPTVVSPKLDHADETPQREDEFDVDVGARDVDDGNLALFGSRLHSGALDERMRYSRQRRDYVFPPVVDKLHKGLPTYAYK